MEQRIKQLEAEIKAIHERNQAVDRKKAWETSWTRKLGVAIITYLFMTAFLWFLGTTNPWLNALVPTCGFLLSTVSLDLLKEFWQRNLYKA